MRTNEKFIQHLEPVLSSPTVGKKEVDAFIEMCKKHHLLVAAYGPGCWLEYTSKQLQGTGIALAAPVGMPNGTQTTECKIFEAQDSIKKGATEIDVSLNIGWMLEGRYQDAEEDIRRVVKACGDGIITKVILETCFLNEQQKREAVRLCKRAGATYVKTSSGWGGRKGATLEDIKLMAEEAGDSILIKASGGIRTREFAEQLLDAGAERVGSSRPLELL